MGLVIGSAFVILFAIFSPMHDERTWMAYSPIECVIPPWGFSSLEADQISNHYQSHGITIYDASLVEFGHCEGCKVCSAGYKIYLQVAAKDLQKMEQIGFDREVPR